MWCKIFHMRRKRIKHSQVRSAQSAVTGERIEAQWPEVTRLSTWARDTREQNHLTELFLHGRRST